jgi:hypothetical protein
MELINAASTPSWFIWAMLAVALWVTPWKGVALWKAAGNKQLVWFICLLIINTLAILEIIYIFGFSKKKS